MIDEKLLEGYDEASLYLKSITTFFMWAKMLYFLRIFPAFAYLIRMIVQVCLDMKVFMFILLVVILAFADSFYGISRENEPEHVFAETFWDALMYAFLMALGDWSVPDALGKKVIPMAYILFLLSTIFNLIVMLNLLIAIISETFAEVNSNAEKFGYKEKAQLIAENSYLIPGGYKRKICQRGSFLLIANEVDQLHDTDKLLTNIETLVIKVKDLKEDFKDFKETLLEKIEEQRMPSPSV